MGGGVGFVAGIEAVALGKGCEYWNNGLEKCEGGCELMGAGGWYLSRHRTGCH